MSNLFNTVARIIKMLCCGWCCGLLLHCVLSAWSPRLSLSHGWNSLHTPHCCYFLVWVFRVNPKLPYNVLVGLGYDWAPWALKILCSSSDSPIHVCESDQIFLGVSFSIGTHRFCVGFLLGYLEHSRLNIQGFCRFVPS